MARFFEFYFFRFSTKIWILFSLGFSKLSGVYFSLIFWIFWILFFLAFTKFMGYIFLDFWIFWILIFLNVLGSICVWFLNCLESIFSKFSEFSGFWIFYFSRFFFLVFNFFDWTTELDCNKHQMIWGENGCCPGIVGEIDTWKLWFL